MLKILRPRSTKRLPTIPVQCSCHWSNDASRQLEKSSEKQLEKVVDTFNAKALAKKTDVTKEDLIWRTPWHKKNGEYFSLLRIFHSESNNVSKMKFIQQPIDISPSAIKKWIQRRNTETDIMSQMYMSERQAMLGPELACAHFIVARGGAVKFHDEDKWIKAVDGNYELPDRYKEGMFVQAIDCENTNLRYEGLDNFRGLKNVEWLSFNGCKHIDDFCIDAISNIFSDTLKYLDLRDCFGVSERGIGALYKMHDLKVLYLDDLLKDSKYELTCLLLEELNQELVIKSDVITFEVK